MAFTRGKAEIYVSLFVVNIYVLTHGQTVDLEVAGSIPVTLANNQKPEMRKRFGFFCFW